MKLFLPKSDSDEDTSEPSSIEVAGAFDAFVSLEEIAPDTDWNEALSDAWGIPSNPPKPDQA